MAHDRIMAPEKFPEWLRVQAALLADTPIGGSVLLRAATSKQQVLEIQRMVGGFRRSLPHYPASPLAGRLQGIKFRCVAQPVRGITFDYWNVMLVRQDASVMRIVY